MWARCVAILLLACLSGNAFSQTPSPMQEWQYSRGWLLMELLGGPPPEWQFVTGVGAERAPLYDGASTYRTRAGPLIEVRYADLAFASVGDGIGVNVLRGRNYVAGVSVGYDLGRYVSDDSVRLRGLNNISRAPVFKLFYSYVVSQSFPLVLRTDLRKLVGGASGVIGDADAYFPLPGSSASFQMFVGPSMTWSNHAHEETIFGVSDAEAASSAYPQFAAHAGIQSAGVGFSTTRIISNHWLLSLDAAFNRLIGSARNSPITQQREQHVVSLSAAYKW
jgi:outer membrane scaffolding protein for murein synthesis (MipA/OmpV family)